MERTSGILLPIFSLPSPHGIGTLGRAACDFADFLSRAGQRWWQILPVNPAGAGRSPYSSVSAYAGDPLLIDLELLTQDGLLDAGELAEADAGTDGERVCYEALERSRELLLRRAFARGRSRDAARVRVFAEKNADWLPDYALFMAARTYFGGMGWADWPDEGLRRHDGAAAEQWRGMLADEVAFHTYVQYLFRTQWERMRNAVHGRGIGIIGDLPIYVSLDSADVWAAQQFFQLDETGHPRSVAGVPPDYFSADGQLWGNPLYDWEAMRRDGYGWWIRRIGGASGLFDVIRIDHFRAFESYWSIPAAAKSAREGRWMPGPGMALLSVLRGWFPEVSYIAEDLGLLTPAVHALREAAQMPGMKVLEFAFDGPDNAYLPHNYADANCVCYIGTHDNDTAAGWYEHAAAGERAFAEQYLGAAGGDGVCRALLRAGMGSAAELFISQMQDWMGLGSSARINTPGTVGGNWTWRLPSGGLCDELAGKIRRMTWTFGRCAEEENPPAD